MIFQGLVDSLAVLFASAFPSGGARQRTKKRVRRVAEATAPVAVVETPVAPEVVPTHLPETIAFKAIQMLAPEPVLEAEPEPIVEPPPVQARVLTTPELLLCAVQRAQEEVDSLKANREQALTDYKLACRKKKGKDTRKEAKELDERRQVIELALVAREDELAAATQALETWKRETALAADDLEHDGKPITVLAALRVLSETGSAASQFQALWDAKTLSAGRIVVAAWFCIFCRDSAADSYQHMLDALMDGTLSPQEFVSMAGREFKATMSMAGVFSIERQGVQK